MLHLVGGLWLDNRKICVQYDLRLGTGKAAMDGKSFLGSVLRWSESTLRNARESKCYAAHSTITSSSGNCKMA